ncbi:MAG TPA: G1 family glutamic endopeptidase [Candidatus Saccharimonadales bacterium]|nr:G1 family glutamic endopeptidase [Candidatus Saccharimonadales bacterium]
MTKLNEIGIAHYLVPLSFVVLFAFIGVRIMTASHAKTIDVYHAIGYAKSANIQTTVQNHALLLAQKTSQPVSSRIWAGYAVNSVLPRTLFRKIQATWVQPKVTCDASQAWTVFWVGLDGLGNNNVEQAGSEAYCDSVGATPTYNLWWETYPYNPIQTEDIINAGDTINAVVIYNPANSTITMAVKDITTGQQLIHSVACSLVNCPRISAEVVSEDVGRYGSDSYFPLANYGKVSYSKVSITDSEPKTGNVINTSWRTLAITEQDAGIKYASVSALSAQGTAFSTTWLHQ